MTPKPKSPQENVVCHKVNTLSAQYVYVEQCKKILLFNIHFHMSKRLIFGTRKENWQR